MLLYLLVLATAAAGLAQWPVWTALVGGTAIGLVNIGEQSKLRPRFAAVDAGEVLTTAHLACLAIGWIGGLVAWAVGRFSWWAYWS